MGVVQQLHSTPLSIFLCPLMTQIRGSRCWGGRDTGRRAWGPKEIVLRPGREPEGMARGWRQLWGGQLQAGDGDRVENEAVWPGYARVHVVFKRQDDRIRGGLKGTFCNSFNCFLEEKGTPWGGQCCASRLRLPQRHPSPLPSFNTHIELEGHSWPCVSSLSSSLVPTLVQGLPAIPPLWPHSPQPQKAHGPGPSPSATATSLHMTSLALK